MWPQWLEVGKWPFHLIPKVCELLIEFVTVPISLSNVSLTLKLDCHL